MDFDYIPNPNHSIKFGVSYTNHEFFPGESSLLINTSSPDTSENFSLDTNFNFSKRTRVNESYFYIEDNIKISSRLQANIGLHIGYYSLANESKINNIIDIYSYMSNEEFISIQPRISARYLLRDNWSIKRIIFRNATKYSSTF